MIGLAMLMGMAKPIDERAAAVARVDRRVGLDQAVQVSRDVRRGWSVAGDGDVPPQGRNDPLRGAVRVGEPVRATDGDRHLAHLQRGRVADGRGHEIEDPVDLDDGQVRQSVHAVGRAGDPAVVREANGDGLGPDDDVLVRQDPAAHVVDDPGADERGAGAVVGDDLHYRGTDFAHGGDDGRRIGLDRDALAGDTRRRRLPAVDYARHPESGICTAGAQHGADQRRDQQNGDEAPPAWAGRSRNRIRR
jgi:hypothetical protein